MKFKDEQFTEAEKYWDLKTLYSDLSVAKGKPLTPMEKLHLRALLLGYSPSDIAEKLEKNPNGVKTDLCASIYRYVKLLLDKCEERIESYRNICEWLESAGYRCENSSNNALNNQSVVNISNNIICNITNINYENKSLIINLSLRVPTDSNELDIVLEKLDNNGQNTN
jgi:hypothetical protein